MPAAGAGFLAHYIMIISLHVNLANKRGNDVSKKTDKKTSFNSTGGRLNLPGILMKLLKIVQQELGYTALQQINVCKAPFITQTSVPPAYRFGQAAIPAVLIGFCAYSQSGSRAAGILYQPPLHDWISELFGEVEKDLVTRISLYAQVTHPDSFLRSRLQDIAAEVVRSVKKHLGPAATSAMVRHYFFTQKKDILKYLPAALLMDVLLQDSSLCTTAFAPPKTYGRLSYLFGKSLPPTMH